MSVQPIYGIEPSPITPRSMAQGRRLRDIAWDAQSGTLVWIEQRSDRGVLVGDALDGHAPVELTAEHSVRAQVGYGGGDMTAGGASIYYVADGGNGSGVLYRQAIAGGPSCQLTPDFGQAAAPALSPDGRWLLYVHSWKGDDCLAIASAEGDHELPTRWPQRLVYGSDFYMQPVWSLNVSRGLPHIAWVEWDHPYMPWERSRIGLATLRLDDDALPSVEEIRCIGDAHGAALFQPTFSPDGRTLAYLSDVSGWSGFYLTNLESGESSPLWVEEAELGEPAWAQGMRTFAWSPDGGTIYVCRNDGFAIQLWSVEVATGQARPIEALGAMTHVSQPCVSPAGVVALIASSSVVPPRIIAWDPRSDEVWVRARAESERVLPEMLCPPERLSWRSFDGEEVHGLLYRPRVTQDSAGRQAGDSAPGAPPLIVRVHGGPTGQTMARYSGDAQFFATRGYAVLEVNYRGSAGYGRAYRSRLDEQWGVIDVDDVVSGAQHLAAQGMADGNRMVIMGGSAGGYTVLQSLIRYPGVFKAGLSLYGVTNLFTLATDTHKFEQHYLDSLIGPLPQAAERYRERSPEFHADLIRDPVAIFQGEEDQVVPKSQAEAIIAALRRSGVPHEYHLYPGEGHGWRKAETIETFYQDVLAFLRQYVLYA
jgi:dipeptidyl aminopeptidase/acylaminoacyl peptidase